MVENYQYLSDETLICGTKWSELKESAMNPNFKQYCFYVSCVTQSWKICIETNWLNGKNFVEGNNQSVDWVRKYAKIGTCRILETSKIYIEEIWVEKESRLEYRKLD